VAFILGPLLMTASALVLLAGVGVNPPPFDWSSHIEAVIGIYGIILFIPVYLELARLLGQKSPGFGLVTTVTGLFGAACGAAPMAFRIVIHDVVVAGASPELLAAMAGTETWQSLAAFIICILFPITSILLGIGLLRSESVAGWQSVLLIVAGVVFLIAQAAEIAVPVTNLIAHVTWLAALVPLGLRYLGSADRQPDNAG
jgi:hypothetical protein